MSKQDLEVQEGFRLTFLPLGSTLWQLYIDIDQYCWYQLLKKKAYENKTMYLDSIVQNYLYHINFESTKEQELLQSPLREMPYYPEQQICDWHDALTKCKEMKKKGKCNNIHKKELLCLCSKNCGLALHRQLHIKFLSDKGFCIHSRLEPSRDLLMLTRKHYHPEKLIQRRQFWDKIIKTIGLIQNEFPLLDLPIQFVYINFGSWSTQTKYSRKVHSTKLHGLTHFLLSSEAM